MRFVHLAPALQETRIRRSGLAGSAARVLTGASETTTVRKAVFAMPVVADFWTTYQWLRELRRSHDERIVAVYFRLSDAEPVLVGRYDQPHATMTASASAQWVTRNPRGAEVLVPRPVRPREVLRTRAITQLVGWTEAPEQERHLRCLCQGCVPRGARDLMRRVRGAIAEALLAARKARAAQDVLAALGSMEIPLERARGRIPPDGVIPFARSPNARIRQSAARLLGSFPRAHVESRLLALALDPDEGVSEEAVQALARVAGVRRGTRLLEGAPEPVVMRMLDQIEYETDAWGAVSALEAAAGITGTAIARRVGELAAALALEPDVPTGALVRLRELAGARAGLTRERE